MDMNLPTMQPAETLLVSSGLSSSLCPLCLQYLACNSKRRGGNCVHHKASWPSQLAREMAEMALRAVHVQDEATHITSHHFTTHNFSWHLHRAT